MADDPRTTPHVYARLKRENAALKTALEEAIRGIEWWCDRYPETASECDNEALTGFRAALSSPSSAPSEESRKIDYLKLREVLREKHGLCGCQVCHMVEVICRDWEPAEDPAEAVNDPNVVAVEFYGDGSSLIVRKEPAAPSAEDEGDDNGA